MKKKHFYEFHRSALTGFALTAISKYKLSVLIYAGRPGRPGRPEILYSWMIVFDRENPSMLPSS